MTSTYLSYRIYGAHMPQTQQRLASMPEQANLQKYFDQNIGKVKTVDDFLKDYKLFSYAMKAFGLDDMMYAKALIRKVLISDPNDPKSTANQLNDPRYKQLAQAFNFDTSGRVRSNGTLQTGAQQQDLDAHAGYDLSAQIGKVKSIKDLLGNDGLYNAVLDAFGLTGKVTKDQVKAALETDRSKPNNFLDTAGQALRGLALDFNFTTNGDIGQPTLLQSPQNIAAAQTAYMATVPDDADSQAAATRESAYYQDKMTRLTSIDQVVADPRLVAYIKQAYGIDPFMTTQELKAVLTSNLNDPSSAANRNSDDPKNTHAALQNLAASFNFGPNGTIVDRSASAQSPANLSSAVDAYIAAIPPNDDPQAAAAARAAALVETQHYTAVVAAATSVDDIVNDPRALAVLKTAYNLPNASASDIRAILTSNLNDPSSAANQAGATARKLALAFNFRTDGTVGSSKLLQTPAAVAQMQRKYMANILQDSDSQAAGADESVYYARKLADATSVDDLVSDPRIVRYLQIAYPDIATLTTDQLKTILTGNVFDPASLVNTETQKDQTSHAPLSPAQTLRAAFNIGTDGLAPDATKAAQTAGATSATIAAYAAATGTSEAAAAEGAIETSYYRYTIGQVRSVDDIVNNPRLLDYLKTAFYLPNAKKEDIKAILTSDPNDPTGAAAKAGPAGLALVNAFTFDANGATARPPLALAPQQLDKVRQAYAQSVVGRNSTADALATETSYFTNKMLSATRVEDITSDPRLVSYIKAAFGLDDDVPSGDVLKDILTSNLADPTSYANTKDAAAGVANALTPSQAVAAAFDVGIDGKPYDHSTAAQTPTAAKATAAAYNKALGILPWSASRTLTADDQAVSDAAAAETSYFNYAVGRARNVDDLVGDPRVVAYLKTAFNLPIATAADLRAYLTSDLTKPDSAANKAGSGARSLATSFAFAPDGEIYNQQPIESQTSVSAAVAAYKAQLGTSDAAKARGQAATDYFQSTIPYVRTVDDLLGDNKLTSYLKAAYGIPPATSSARLKQILTSDIKNPKSLANQLGGGYQKLAAAFNVGPDGKISMAGDTALQTKAQAGATRASFIEAAVETDAGNNYGDGVRLALYFRAKAPTLTDGYQILADKALTKVVQTALGMSSQSSGANIDAQARYIASKIKFADLKDPAKLEKFISRFSNLYDLQNNQSSSPTAVFGSGGGN